MSDQQWNRRVVIVGGLGRGGHLAAQLSNKLIPVDLPQGRKAALQCQFLDLSKRFPWAQDSWQGPFPHLGEGADHEIVSRSYAIFTEKGPLELGNRDQLQVSLKKYPGMARAFSHLVSSVEYGPLQTLEVATKAGNFPERLHQPVRRWRPAESISEDKSLDVDLEDLSFDKANSLLHLLVKAGRTEVRPAHQLVWCFSSGETEFLNRNIFSKLYQEKKREPVYSWLLFKIDFSTAPDWPPEFLWVNDPLLHWSHENCVAMRRDAASHVYQAWIRIPSAHRFSNEYLQEEERKLNRLLIQSRLTRKQVFRIERPAEWSAGSSTLGPALYNSYREGDWSRNKIELAQDNLHYLNFERTRGLNWNSFSELEAEIEERMISWWNREVEGMKKKLKKIKTESQPGEERAAP